MADAEAEARDWAEMPSDALAAVFVKLDVAEILTGAGLVCRAWRRLAATDPTLWRHVDMCLQGDLLETEEAEAMARAAVDRAAGTMEAFWADNFVTDDLLRYLSQR
jgi:predicted negative regulator of RcsB-dependent stress response